MKLTGTLLLPTPDGKSVRLAPGSVVVEGDRIASVTEGGSAGDTLICPAFTDTHLHLPQFDIIGAHGFTLLDWLNTVTFPAERRWEDAGFAEAMTHRAIDQLFAVGTTGICAYATVHHDATMRAIDAAKARRMRGRIGQTLMDREAPDYLTRPADQLLAECRQTLEAASDDARVTAAVTPRFAISCTDDLLRGAGALAAAFDAFIQTHLAETVAECDYVRKLFSRDYVDVYADAELLGPKAIHGHGIHLTDADRRKLADTQTVIAHCPLANSFLMSGTMDRRSLHADHVRTGLGSDIGGGYERSMVRVARAMLEASAALHGEAIPASAAWWQITAGNADVAGWPNAGRLAAGCVADVLVIEPDIAWRDLVDPLSMLLFAWDDRWVYTTIAAGDVVYRAE